MKITTYQQALDAGHPMPSLFLPAECFEDEPEWIVDPCGTTQRMHEQRLQDQAYAEEGIFPAKAKEEEYDLPF